MLYLRFERECAVGILWTLIEPDAWRQIGEIRLILRSLATGGPLGRTGADRQIETLNSIIGARELFLALQ